MKRLFAFFVFLVFLGSLSGCVRKNDTLSQAADNIATIDIIYVSPYAVVSLETLKTTEAIVTIPNEHFSLLIEELRLLPSHSNFLDPPQGISKHALRIGYQDGSMEWICSIARLYYANGKTKWEYFSYDDDFDALVLKWIDISEGEAM